VSDRYDVVVAGGGIAGLTAGLFSARLGRSTLILTGAVPGGLLLNIESIEGVPGFPEGVPGYELCPIAQEQAEAAGAEFRMTEVSELERDGDGWTLATAEGDVSARAVIAATGAQLAQLGVPGEDRLHGRGVSHCATCDGPLLGDRVVAVVGGGDSALQEALTLAGFASQVIVIERQDELPAQRSFRERVEENAKIDVRLGEAVEEILGDETVTGVRTSGGELEVGAVFAYVGLRPSSEPFAGLVELVDDGRVPVDAEMRTAAEGLFAAGVLRSGAACQAAGSAGDGATAAKAADRFLDGEQWPADMVAAGRGG
jgi:thioredoxin reductase (NADPH)